MEDASAVYQHRYGDGSVAISSSINFGSPRQDGLSNQTSIDTINYGSPGVDDKENRKFII